MTTDNKLRSHIRIVYDYVIGSLDVWLWFVVRPWFAKTFEE